MTISNSDTGRFKRPASAGNFLISGNFGSEAGVLEPQQLECWEAEKSDRQEVSVGTDRNMTCRVSFHAGQLYVEFFLPSVSFLADK